MTTRVFVYGTLRRGQRNAALLGSARYVGAATTRAAFDLWCFGGWPAVTPGGTTAIAGELYDVDAHTLARLDALEEVPDVYQRVAMVTDEGDAAAIWVMRPGDVGGAHAVAGGDWVAHCAAAGCGRGEDR